MSLKSVMVQLSQQQIDALDREAQRRKMSRSALVRAAVDELFAPPPWDATIAAQYAAAYPDGKFGTDDWGDLDEWHAAAAKDRGNMERDPW